MTRQINEACNVSVAIPKKPTSDVYSSSPHFTLKLPLPQPSLSLLVLSLWFLVLVHWARVGVTVSDIEQCWD